MNVECTYVIAHVVNLRNGNEADGLEFQVGILEVVKVMGVGILEVGRGGVHLIFFLWCVDVSMSWHWSGVEWVGVGGVRRHRCMCIFRLFVVLRLSQGCRVGQKGKNVIFINVNFLTLFDDAVKTDVLLISSCSLMQDQIVLLYYRNSPPAE